MPYEFVYSIIDVVLALGLTIRKDNGVTLDVDCPFCSPNLSNGHDGKGKLNIVIEKNFAHCCRCGYGGGMLKLYGYVRGCDEKTAHKEMLQFVHRDSYEQVIKENKAKFLAAQKKSTDLSKRAPNSVLDKTFRALLNELTLSTKHLNALTSPKRGLTIDTIKGQGYKTVPTRYEDRIKVTNSLLRKGCQLEGVPGFYINKKGYWDISTNYYFEGFFVPYVNPKKQVVGLQICLDNPNDGNKYMWLSSKNKLRGVTSGSPIHITSTRIPKTLFLTEGALKANIASRYSGKVFMAIAGVNNQKNIAEYFKLMRYLGVKRIVDCFDTDCKDNPQVEKARWSIKFETENAGLLYSRMSWDSNFKAIDDYVLGVPKDKWKFEVINF